MGQGGIAKTYYSKVAESIAKLAEVNEDFKTAAEDFVQSEGITDKDLTNVADILELFQGDKGQKLLHGIQNKLSKEQITSLLEQFSKDPIIIQKADNLGRNIAIGATGVIAGGILGGAIGANFGAISAGLGAAGAGIAAAAPFIAIGAAVLLAIALIALAIYKRKAISENIKGGAKYVGEKVEDIGKGVVHLLKNFIDMLSPGPSNAVEHVSNCYVNNDTNNRRIAKGEPLPDDAAFIKQYLLNEDGFKALTNLIKEKDGKIRLDDTDIELTLKDLTRLKEKGDSKLSTDKAGLTEELSKFKLIMSEAHEEIRKEVEAEQDKIHTKNNLETPLPSSALYPGSNANTEFLLQIPENTRKDVKNLLDRASGFTKPFREGSQGLYQELDKLCKLKGESYALDSSVLEGNDSNALATLAKGLKDFTSNDITLLIAGIRILQSQGPRAEVDGVQLTSLKPLEHEK
ncbi:hypothetical protein [Wolbachia endosymbiont of Folsomia candida]|uniref:hypothetical protein n=1 Tax=Wolbachia endosymbiont of Folsomia candida TaxID=169402 RepID=UPI000AD3ECC8|nr:hypothetical protein [Wolbachia endosymbiont of Folsomia candida]APR98730.1 hypothetical protein ASM33_05830 [Wolbachia endosymbiont of Folsomia candida]